MKKLAVLISGNGSNLQAIIDRWKRQESTYEVCLVLSNKEDAFGLKRAEKAGIEQVVLPHQGFSNREEYDRELDRIFSEKGIELVALAGFMRLLSPWLVERWSGKILNIHPSLLPAFPGLNAQKQALDYGVKFSGCSVFFVDNGVDTGPIIEQAVVAIQPGDTLEVLSKRILKEEHRIFPMALDLVAKGKVELKEGRIVSEP